MTPGFLFWTARKQDIPPGRRSRRGSHSGKGWWMQVGRECRWTSAHGPASFLGAGPAANASPGAGPGSSCPTSGVPSSYGVPKTDTASDATEAQPQRPGVRGHAHSHRKVNRTRRDLDRKESS